MREVGVNAIQRAKAALNALGKATERGVNEGLAADRKVKALALAGKLAQAEQFGRREQARLQLLYVSIGVRFEAAVVEVLGERRREDEDLMSYAARIGETVGDLGAALEMQRRNGIALTVADDA